MLVLVEGKWVRALRAMGLKVEGSGLNGRFPK